MNTRIRELAEQAGVDAGQTIANIICGDDEFKALGNEFNKLSQETREYIYKVIGQNQEKFGELIVRECADVLVAEMNRLDGLDRVVASQTMDTAQVLIKQHFGVEEC